MRIGWKGCRKVSFYFNHASVYFLRLHSITAKFCIDAKRILLDAISLDTRFLSSQSIMDYSLLLGVDTRSSLLTSLNISEDKVEQERGNGLLIVGLVDAIGSFNLFKTIESRGKMVMNRGGDVTVVSSFFATLVVLKIGLRS